MATSRGFHFEDLIPPNDEKEVPCKGLGSQVDFTLGNEGRLDRDARSNMRRVAKNVIGDLCSHCPIENHAWCIESVKPSKTKFTGVAGGMGWLKGHRVI